MEELKDYSGAFKPNLKYTDFSKEALIHLWKSASKLYQGMAGIWSTIARNKLGDETAFTWEPEAWKKLIPLEIKWVCQEMNIKGDDVETLFKWMQCYAAYGPTMDFDLDLKNKKHGIFTVKKCPALEYFERHDDVKGQENACGMDVWGFQLQATCINPKIKCNVLRMPPRKSKDEICCQMEYILED